MPQQLATDNLESNLAAMARASGDAVARIRAASTRPDIEFFDTLDGVPTAQIGFGPDARLLASKRRPLDEAAKLVGAIDIKGAAVFVVGGFGMGYHVAELSRRVGRTGIVMVFEPDVAMLRAVLERADHARWIAAGNVCILTDPDDGAAMGEALRGMEGMVGMGLTLVRHPPSDARIGPLAARFHDRLTGIVESVKMTVLTTLVQVRVTMRNLMQNADIYATRGGLRELAGACKGRPGIVVSAGPSLQRNVDLLKDPKVRESCVIVAVQTVLKPLLAKGIRPHFVTALDFSEINKRFYEGLTKEKVEGITLVIEPKVNPSVPMSWPGKVLCAGDATLNLLLGKDLARDHGHLKQGATVAHLAHYLARHLGCNPVALIGQDLGFTDGQYYAAGASIHNVWAGEINEFKSLELMEWQRIVRMGPHLRPTTDTLGRPVYTDSQMRSYLMQFETDFRDDAAAGLTTIDATEGGVHKQGAESMPLREFLSRFGRAAGPSIDELIARAISPLASEGGERERILKALKSRVTDVRKQVGRIADISGKTVSLLTEMQEHHADQIRVDRLIAKAQANGKEAESLAPGFQLVQLLGQATVFNRVRADRLIGLEEGLSDMERQGLQVRRDIENVRGLCRTAEELASMLDGCAAMLSGAPRITRDLPKSEMDLEKEATAARNGRVLSPSAPVRASIVSAVVPIDLDRAGAGWARSLEGAFAGHPSVLAATVDRLLACTELRDITLVCDDTARVRSLLSEKQLTNARVRIEAFSIKPDQRRQGAIQVGRLWARECWRGGLGDLTIFDEVFDPRACAAVLEKIGADAALVVGPDWAAVDPDLCGQIIRRHRENPEQYRLAFSQAAPGLCGCVISRDLAQDLARGEDSSRLVFATVGGVLGYVPMAPLQDLIAHPICIGLSGPVRDCGLRLIADTPAMRLLLEKALKTNAEGAEGIVKCVQQEVGGMDRATFAQELIVAGNEANVQRHIAAFAIARPWSVMTIGDGASDPIECEQLWDWINAAKAAGIAAVHVRTSLRGADDAVLRRLVESRVDVISVDCGDGSDLAAMQERIERLMQMRKEHVGDDGLGIPWIVPRLTRCDATYGAVEEFINRWVARCGWAALDPLREARSGERIAPLPLPAAAAERMMRTRGVP